MARWGFDQSDYPIAEVFSDVNEQKVFGVTVSTDDFQQGTGSGIFNGTDAYLQLDRTRFGNNFPNYPLSAFTFTAWIRPNEPSAGTQVLYEQGGELNNILSGVTIRLHNGQLEAGWRAISTGVLVTSQTNAPEADVWTHIACTVDTASNTMKLYVNGVEAASITDPAIVETGGIRNTTALGARAETDVFNETGSGATDFYNGSMDEVRAYITALDSAGVAALAGL